MGRADFYPMNPAIERAYASSNLIAVEADITNQEAMQDAIQSARFAAPDTLEHHITPALAQNVSRLARDMGLNIQQMLGAQAWLAMSQLSNVDLESMGYQSRYGTDAYFLARAKNDSKKIIELETISNQFTLFNGFSDFDQSAMLEETVESIDSLENISSFQDMLEAWQAGNLDCFSRLVQSSFDAHPNKEMLIKKLFTERNERMADKIEALLKDKNVVFVVVGAGHLVGEDSVPVRLQRKGFDVLQHWGSR